MFQEVIRPFSAHVAAINADITRPAVPKCVPLTSPKPQEPPAAVPALPGPSHLAEASSPSDSISGYFQGRPQQHTVSADKRLADDSHAATARQVPDLEQGPLEWLGMREPEMDAAIDAQPAQEQPGLDEATFSKARPHTAAVLRAHPGGTASKVPDHAEHHQLLRLPIRNGPGQAISSELQAQRALSWPNTDVSTLLPCLLHTWACVKVLHHILELASARCLYSLLVSITFSCGIIG